MSDDKRLLMCEENVKVGMRLGPIFYTVAPEQVDSFTTALDDRSALFASSAPDGARLAPPTMRLLDYALLIAAHFRGGSGGVHAKQRMELIEPMRVGQSIRVDGAITEAYRKRGKFYFVLEYEQRDAESGQLLVRQAITAVLLNDGGMR
ncbi:MAG: FAS1-like dehydratase domain-containing protein [Candidatus Binataceae bacterium]